MSCVKYVKVSQLRVRLSSVDSADPSRVASLGLAKEV